MKRLLILLVALALCGCQFCIEDGGGMDARFGTCNPCQPSSDPEVQDAGGPR